MLSSLYKFLVLNDHVSIPGVGTFEVQRTAASFDGNAFQPPVQTIVFEAGTALAEKKFYDFLAADHDFSGLDAVRKFQDFAYQLKKDIQSNNSVELSGLGILKKNNLGAIVFEPSAINQYFPKLTATEVEQRQNTSTEHAISSSETVTYPKDETQEEEVVEKDRWWIWATILALLALAAIGYFYLTNM